MLEVKSSWALFQVPNNVLLHLRFIHHKHVFCSHQRNVDWCEYFLVVDQPNLKGLECQNCWLLLLENLPFQHGFDHLYGDIGGLLLVKRLTEGLRVASHRLNASLSNYFGDRLSALTVSCSLYIRQELLGFLQVNLLDSKAPDLIELRVVSRTVIVVEVMQIANVPIHAI